MDLLNLTFAYPALLLLAVGLIPLAYLDIFRRMPARPMRISSLAGLPRTAPPLRVRLRRYLPLLRYAALACGMIALARPQKQFQELLQDTEGIDIVLSMDLSRSMEKNDFKPTRLDASRQVAQEFVDLRPNDRIGLVIFSGESFTLCPITTDHNLVKTSILSSQYGLLEDGTAIGMGLATAVDRLRESKAASKVVILLTDGANNSGSIDPLTAADIATRYGVKVYTIGMAGLQKVKLPFPAAGDVEIDEDLMQKIADRTGGKYFRATDNNKLFAIYREIDQLERSKVESPIVQRRTEQYYPWLLAGILLLALELGLRYTYFKSLT